jgi:hypothetical protein
MADTDQPTNPALYPATQGEMTAAGLAQVEWMTKHYPERFHDLSMPKGVFKGSREEWLEAAAIIMGGWLNHALSLPGYYTIYRGKASVKYVPVSFLKHLVDTYGGKPSEYFYHPSKVRYACSLQDGGMTQGKSLAHVHFMHSTGNNYHEIRMSVGLGGRKRKGDSARVADVLLHEMIHTCATRHGHGGAFKRIAENIGLIGPMTATTAGPALASRIWEEVVSVLGRYPHNSVKLVPRGQRGKGSRLIKCTCANCGFNMRTTRKWIDQAYALSGSLACPIGCPLAMIHPEYSVRGEEE